MRWLADFYKREKSPWIGFFLVVLFGPFGFLYHSWKTALAILLVVGPLWIAFLRHTRFDLIENPWAHYIALLACGAFASLQILAQRTKTAQNSAPADDFGSSSEQRDAANVYGIRRATLPLKEVAAIMADMVLTPAHAPSEQDAAFERQAEEVGVPRERFAFEVVALQCYAMTQAIARERVEGRMDLTTQKLLTEEVLRGVHDRLRSNPLGLDADTAMELIFQRGERYFEPAMGRGAMSDVQKFFAEFCGFPGSAVLERIGWSLFQVRGDMTGSWLSNLTIAELGATK